MDHLVNYIRNRVLPASKNETQSIHFKSARYIPLDDKLCRRGLSAPLLQYVTDEEENYIMREIHKGIYGNHTGGRL